MEVLRRFIYPIILIYLLSGALAPHPLEAQIFQEVIATSDANEPNSVTSADLDGDGNEDILAAFGDEVGWFENRIGESRFLPDGFSSKQVIASFFDGAYSVTAADLDGDGDEDVVAASAFNDRIHWWENQLEESGSVRFESKVITTSVLRPISVTLTDLDGDGDKDLLSASVDDGKVAWYENQIGEEGADSDGFGNQQVITSDPSEARSVTAADLNGDSSPDVISASDSKITWYGNQVGQDGADSDGFGSQRVINSNASNARSVAVADIDGDSSPDVIAGSSSEVVWHRNQLGDGSSDSDGFGEKNTIASGVGGIESVIATDLDGDSNPDVLSASEDDNRVAWYKNRVGESGADSDGFGAQQIINARANFAQSVAATDLDGNGDAEVLSASRDDDTIAWYENQIGESGADNDGFGSPLEVTRSVSDVESVTSADLNKDGEKDVLSASKDDDKIAWYKNGGGGYFGSQKVISVRAFEAQSVTAVDIDGDGYKDVLSSSSGTSYPASLPRKVAWYENQIGEDGTDSDGFGEERVIITAESSIHESAATADLDGDGDPDVIATFKGKDEIGWHENQLGEEGADSDGFGSKQVIATGVGGNTDSGADRTLTTADLDGDSDPDILFGTPDYKVVWYENQIGESGADSDGFANERVISTSDQGVNSLTAADLNRDGNPDVLFASGSDGEVGWYENQVGDSGADSDGFGSQQIISSISSPQSVTAADLNGNSKPDVVAGAAFDGITWYENQLGEDGSDSDGFGSSQQVNDQGIDQVAAADLSGNSSPDIFSASWSDDKIAWYENTSSVLPVEMANIEAIRSRDGAVLKWRTASEQNNAGFEVHRRVDNAPGADNVALSGETSWKEIGFVEGGGTTSQPQTYRFEDSFEKLPFAADTVSYRLRQIDTNGSAHYSKVVRVERSVSNLQIRPVAPNPASHTVNLRYAVPSEDVSQGSTIHVRVYDALGREVRTVQMVAGPGRHKRQLDVSGLASGTYFLRFSAAGETVTQKVTVVK